RQRENPRQDGGIRQPQRNLPATPRRRQDPIRSDGGFQHQRVRRKEKRVSKAVRTVISTSTRNTPSRKRKRMTRVGAAEPPITGRTRRNISHEKATAVKAKNDSLPLSIPPNR